MTASRARLRELLLSRDWPHALLLALLKLGVSAAVLASGFHAISDDDFARVVIAQRFSEAPALDPSGTSWLPLPFWVYGAALGLFGSTPAVARGTAIALGVAATWLLFGAARALGQSRGTACVGAAIGALFPYSAYLGVATVPEVPSAALSVFGAAALTRTGSLRWLGALALFLATACRYEPWAAAFAFSAFCLWQALRAKDPKLLGPALLASAFPVLWLLHGVFRHGDALFFVARVTAYRAALGIAPEALSSALSRTPLAFFTQEPELVLASLVVCGAWLVRARAWSARLAAFSLPFAAIVLMLMIGDVRASTPTHHGERALLAAWFGLSLLLAEGLAHFTEKLELRVPLAAFGLATLGALLLRPTFPRAPFTDRRGELAIGTSARELGVDELAISTSDYGFFAVQAGFGRPNQTYVYRDHDPRNHAPGASPTLTLDVFARVHHARWLALPIRDAEHYRNAAVFRAKHAPLALIELTPRP